MFSVDENGEPGHGQRGAEEDAAGRHGRWHPPGHDSVPAPDEAEQARLRPALLRTTLDDGSSSFSHLKGEINWTKVRKDERVRHVVPGHQVF